MKFGQLIPRRIIKIIVATRLKCTKFDFGWGSAPDRTGGAYRYDATREEHVRERAENRMSGSGALSGRGRKETIE